MKKYLLFIPLAFIIGISLSSVEGISPFTEIGNLAAETLDAFNMVADAINTLNATQILQQIQIDSFNSTQISEQLEQDGMQTDIATLQAQTKILLDGEFSIPGIAVDPTKERSVNGTIPATFIPLTVDFEFTSFQNLIKFTNGTLVEIPGPHLIPSFVNSIEMSFKEKIANGTIINHPLCSLTAGDSLTECDLIGWTTTVIPQSPTVTYFVDSNADPNIYTIFNYEGIFKITITHP